MAWTREEIAQQAAKELKDGYYVNLGIGIPTLVSNYIPEGMHVVLESENGMLGTGPFPRDCDVDGDLVNASKQTVTLLPWGSFFDSATSFAMIRGGHVDLAILGALEVSETGDIANWMVPVKIVKGMGGAMDLVSGVRRVIVCMDHNSKEGEPKVRKKCILPLTGSGMVRHIITDIAEFEFVPGEGLILTNICPGMTEAEVRARTEANYKVGLQ